MDITQEQFDAIEAYVVKAVAWFRSAEKNYEYATIAYLACLHYPEYVWALCAQNPHKLTIKEEELGKILCRRAEDVLGIKL
jgi:hypothetical protein